MGEEARILPGSGKRRHCSGDSREMRDNKRMEAVT